MTQRRTLGRRGALERGHGASLERLAQLVDALGGVDAAALVVKAAELVASQTAMGKEECQWALTHRHVFEGHLRLCNDVATDSMRPSSPAP